MQPSLGIKQVLLQAPAVVIDGTVSPLTDWAVHVSHMPADQPDKCIAIFDTGGGNPNPSLLLDFPTVQVRVRGSGQDPVGAYTKAKEIKDRLHGLFSQDLIAPLTGRINSLVIFGDINALGRDQNERIEYSMNFRLIIEPATSALTHRIPV